MAGQTINDRLLAAKHSLAGQGLAKSVCKATTEELLGPKKKHLDYLVHCTNEPNVSIPQMANLLMERSQNTSWVVVYKALITAHHIMCYGNERFTQYLASSNVSFQLSNFVDKTSVSGAGTVPGARTGYDMSPFIRRYAKYLNEKALSYRAVAFDFCKVKRGKEEGTMRTMSAENLLKTLPVLQTQLDALLEFDCTANDLTNGVINMCFMLLFRDLIRLFASYNDGIINLLEKYFEMNKKQCREALDLYKKFLIRMDRVGEFLKVAENIGIDKGDIPDLTKAPNSLLDTLEQHLASLEGNTPTATNQKTIKSGVSALSYTSNSFGTAANSTNNQFDENFKQAAITEEEAALNQYKANMTSPGNSSAGLSTNPFLMETQANSEPIIDLFGNDSIPVNSAATTTTNVQASSNTSSSKAIDDLLGLGANPFADFTSPEQTTQQASSATAINLFEQQQQQQQQNGSYMQASSMFGVSNNLSGIFNTNEPSVFDTQANIDGSCAVQSQFQPQPQQQQQNVVVPPSNKQTKILTGDLESSLASLAENLTIDTSRSTPVQWNSPAKNQQQQKNWQPQPMAATTAAAYRPMGVQPMLPQAGGLPQMPGVAWQQPIQQQPQQQNPQDITFDPFGAL